MIRSMDPTRLIPGGVNSTMRRIAGLEDLVVVATDGATITDASGRVYTDFHCAFGPIVLGHKDPDVDRAVTETAGQLDPSGIGATELELELAERLVQLVPSIEKVHFCSSGSEATMHAVRLARAATGRRLVVKFEGSYHGWHDTVFPESEGVLPHVREATLTIPYNDMASVLRALAVHDIAAVIVEPVAHSTGCILPGPGFLDRLRDQCTRHGTVLIFDEVVTGFRHGLGGYQAIAEVTPDLTTLGKAMANGYPIAAVGGRADLMDLFSTAPGGPVLYAGTYNGHPAMAAAALATIRKLEEAHVHDHLFRLGDRVRAGLAEVWERVGVQAVVAGFGSIFVSYFLEPPVRHRRDLERNDAALFVGYRRGLLEQGIFELPANLRRSHLCFAHTEQDVDRLLECTSRAARAVLAGRS